MKTKIAINGFGRIGRNAFKIAFERPDLEIVAVNDIADTKTLAHLLKHDSNYGAYQREVTFDENNIIVEGQAVKVVKEKEVKNLPWKDLGVEIVIESTGLFTKHEQLMDHLEAGAKKVILSAPEKDDTNHDTYIIGVNEDELKPDHQIISNASCTTNCITPVMAVLEANFGIEKAMMTTVHSYTASQRLQDAPAKDMREARNAATNIVPTSTGASIAAAKALPVLENIFGGMSVRVPTPVVSLSDFAVVTKKDVTVEEVNEVFKKAAADPYYQGILDVTEEELVSSDFIGNSHSSIVDLKLTNVVGGNLLKVVAWYDNEWGYSNRLVELTADAARMLDDDQGQDGSEDNDKVPAAPPAEITGDEKPDEQVVADDVPVADVPSGDDQDKQSDTMASSIISPTEESKDNADVSGLSEPVGPKQTEEALLEPPASASEELLPPPADDQAEDHPKPDIASEPESKETSSDSAAAYHISTAPESLEETDKAENGNPFHRF
jgi:glyceraldehyde 3-phosphate dehydrogenase